MDSPDKQRWVAEAAYFIAERRGFADGEAFEDWLEAERRWESANHPFPDAVPDVGEREERAAKAEGGSDRLR